jgi:ribosomal protein S18 acetylase RimI-like enzyme
MIMIRAANEADLPSLLALYGELHPGDPPLSPDVAAATWRGIAAQAGRTVLVAEPDGTVAGTADCTVLPNLTRGARPFLLIENVVVAAAYRRRGVGAALMEASVAIARAAGCYKAQLLSRDSRSAAHAFYESCGFRRLAQGYRLYLD